MGYPFTHPLLVTSGKSFNLKKNKMEKVEKINSALSTLAVKLKEQGLEFAGSDFRSSGVEDTIKITMQGAAKKGAKAASPIGIIPIVGSSGANAKEFPVGKEIRVIYGYSVREIEGKNSFYRAAQPVG